MTMRAPKTLLDVAQRCVWFQPPNETVAEPDFFIAHAFTYGTIDDIAILRAHFTKDPTRHHRRPLLGLLEPDFARFIAAAAYADTHFS
jgi:hypothetical protein